METKLLQLPIPLDLRERLKELADSDRRSMTAQAIWILENEVTRRLASLHDTQLDTEALNDPTLLEKVR